MAIQENKFKGYIAVTYLTDNAELAEFINMGDMPNPNYWNTAELIWSCWAMIRKLKGSRVLKVSREFNYEADQLAKYARIYRT